jgi:hypothetical protein
MQQFAPLEELFKGRHFDQEIVVLCVRWYLSFKLSYRDSSGHDSRAGHRLGPHDDYALGTVLHAGI